MGYSVGNLHLALTGIDKSATKSIDNVITKLNQLNSALSVFDNKNLNGLNKTTKQLESLFKLSKGGGGGGGGRRNGGGSLFGGLKLGATILLARRLATVVGGIVQKGSEYTETLNLWQVSMRDNLDLAERFITKMNKAYGISEKTLMNAQAVFKNMIGSLGQVSDTTAYMLSETLIQMSVDFASLYNTTLQQAFSKIQAMLAGQVRPIRSAGLDMTETTLFMYYQQMGGTKTMRQLNRTEKQLLSIYAVFEQMGKAGALGDMTKTLNTFANQSRITAEAWEELMTWTGVVLRTLIEESGALTFVNAQLIAMGEIMKAVAGSMGATEQNFADTLYESVDETNGALDEMQGKLLDFDKFRSLQGQGENFLGIDEKLLKAITGYDSVIDQANNKAREQAEIWLTNLGFIDENGDGILDITEKAQSFLDTMKGVLNIFGLLFGATIVQSAIRLFTFLKLANANGVALIAGFSALSIGISHFVSAWGDMGWAQRVITMLSALTAGIIGVVVALKSFQVGVPMAIAFGAALSGTVLAIGAELGRNSITKFADGGMPDKGTMFVAGEAGAEIVYNTPSGQSGVVNVKQIEKAMFGALVAYGRTQGGGKSTQPIIVEIDGERVFTVLDRTADRHGVGFMKK